MIKQVSQLFTISCKLAHYPFINCLYFHQCNANPYSLTYWLFHKPMNNFMPTRLNGDKSKFDRYAPVSVVNCLKSLALYRFERADFQWLSVLHHLKFIES